MDINAGVTGMDVITGTVTGTVTGTGTGTVAHARLSRGLCRD